MENIRRMIGFFLKKKFLRRLGQCFVPACPEHHNFAFFRAGVFHIELPHIAGIKLRADFDLHRAHNFARARNGFGDGIFRKRRRNREFFNAEHRIVFQANSESLFGRISLRRVDRFACRSRRDWNSSLQFDGRNFGKRARASFAGIRNSLFSFTAMVRAFARAASRQFFKMPQKMFYHFF